MDAFLTSIQWVFSRNDARLGFSNWLLKLAVRGTILAAIALGYIAHIRPAWYPFYGEAVAMVERNEELTEELGGKVRVAWSAADIQFKPDPDDPYSAPQIAKFGFRVHGDNDHSLHALIKGEAVLVDKEWKLREVNALLGEDETQLPIYALVASDSGPSTSNDYPSFEPVRTPATQPPIGGSYTPENGMYGTGSSSPGTAPYNAGSSNAGYGTAPAPATSSNTQAMRTTSYGMPSSQR